MNLLCPSFVRRKAVWGPKRIVWPLLLILLGITPYVSADGRHVRPAQKKRAGAPGSQVKNYRLDDELDSRSNDRNGAVNTSRVIVELVPGARLPQELKRYARKFASGNVKNNNNNNNSDSNGDDNNLDIINGQVLELPNSVLKLLAKH